MTTATFDEYLNILLFLENIQFLQPCLLEINANRKKELLLPKPNHM